MHYKWAMPAGFSRIADSPRAAIIVLTIAILLAYANIWHNEFVFDDLVLIPRDRFLTSWRYAGTLFSTRLGDGFSGVYYHSPFYRPLQMLLYLFVYQLAGPSPVAFHALNLALHIGNASLLYMLGLRLGFRKDATLCAALLWALHPVHTEAVTYMSGTADPLCALFELAGIIILARGYDRESTLAASACLILALLSKESAVAFPLLAMGVLFYQREDRWSPKVYLKTWPFWAISGIYVGIRVYLSGSSGFLDAFADPNAGFLNRLSTALAALPTYLRLILWPSGLHVERALLEHAGVPFLPILGGIAIIAIAAALAARPTSRTMPLAWGILWAAAAHVPQSGILAPVNAPVCEHWLYFPSMGLTLGAAQYLAGYLAEEGRKTARLGAGTAIVALAMLLGVKTVLQNRIWINSETLFQNAFANGETSERAHINLGEYYLGHGEFDKGIAQLEIPVAGQSRLSRWAELHFLLAAGYLHVNPDKPSVHEEIAEIARALPVAKRIPDAKRELDTALALDPALFWANEMMAQIYTYQGENDEARRYLARAGASAAHKRPGR